MHRWLDKSEGISEKFQVLCHNLVGREKPEVERSHKPASTAAFIWKIEGEGNVTADSSAALTINQEEVEMNSECRTFPTSAPKIFV